MTDARDDVIKRWPPVRQVLLTLRDVVRADLSGTRTAARRTYEQLAREAVLAFGADVGTSAEQGKMLAARLLQRLEELAAEAASSSTPDRYLDASTRAVVGWFLLVKEGLRPRDLYARRPEMFGAEPALTEAARRGRVQHALWIGGNRPAPHAAVGIDTLIQELTAVVGLAGVNRTGVDPAVFAYEWHRLAEVLPEGQALLGVLSMFSPDAPVDVALLREGTEPLPPPLKERVRRTRDFDHLRGALRDRGLLHGDADGIVISAAIRDAVWSLEADPQLRGWCSLAIRMLKSALPADCHFAGSWPMWRLGYPHVLAATAAAERFDVQLGDLPYLLDRASVFRREGEDDAAAAITLAEHGLRISDGLGRPNAEWHSYLMGNLALAHDAAHETTVAIEKMRATAAFDAEMFGKQHEEYVTSLNLLASMLKRVGRLQEAESTFAEALRIMREVYDDNDSDWNRKILIEVLNDYAAFLVQRRKGRRAQRLAEENLEEAARLIRPDEAGYIAIIINQSNLRRLQGRLTDAETLLREVIREVDTGVRPASDWQMLGMLADLAEICGDLGRTTEQERLNERAHVYDRRISARRGSGRADRSS